MVQNKELTQGIFHSSEQRIYTKNLPWVRTKNIRKEPSLDQNKEIHKEPAWFRTSNIYKEPSSGENRENTQGTFLGSEQGIYTRNRLGSIQGICVQGIFDPKYSVLHYYDIFINKNEQH